MSNTVGAGVPSGQGCWNAGRGDRGSSKSSVARYRGEILGVDTDGLGFVLVVEGFVLDIFEMEDLRSSGSLH